MIKHDLAIIRKAISAVSKEATQFKNDQALTSVLAQLRYIEGVISGAEFDLSKLSRLAIGVTAVKMLAQEYPHLVDVLMDADCVSKKYIKVYQLTHKSNK